MDEPRITQSTREDVGPDAGKPPVVSTSLGSTKGTNDNKPFDRMDGMAWAERN
jgi:hypothetical protein